MAPRIRLKFTAERLPPRERRRSIFYAVGITITIILILLVVGLAMGLTVGSRKRAPTYVPLPVGHQVYNGEAILAVVGGKRKLECGWRTEDSEYSVAVGWEIFDAATKEAAGNTELNRLCGLRLRATRHKLDSEHNGGRNVSVDAMVVGKCEQLALSIQLGAW